MAGDTGTGLQQRVFIHSDTEAADFEIAFAATITTIALAFPSPGDSFGKYIQPLAVGLIALTLIRRMAVMNDYGNNEKILTTTSAGLEASTIVIVTYIISKTTVAGPENLILVVLAVVPILLIMLQEVVFQNFFIYFAAYGYDRYLDIDLLRGPAEKVTEQALFLSRADIPDRLRELQYFKKFKEHTSDSPVSNPFNRIVLTFGIVFYGGAFYLLTLLFSNILLTAILFFYVIYLGLIVRFWYAAYGLPSYSELEPDLVERLLYMFTYVIVFYTVFQF